MQQTNKASRLLAAIVRLSSTITWSRSKSQIKLSKSGSFLLLHCWSILASTKKKMPKCSSVNFGQFWCCPFVGGWMISGGASNHSLSVLDGTPCHSLTQSTCWKKTQKKKRQTKEVLWIHHEQRWKNVQILQIYLCYFSLSVLIFWMYMRKVAKDTVLKAISSA